MKVKIFKILCWFGFHKKETYENTREVNWILMSHTITKCKRCKKVF